MTFFHLVGHTRRTSQNSCAWIGDASGSTGFAQSASSFTTWLTLVLSMDESAERANRELHDFDDHAKFALGRGWVGAML
jgi:hypothetical protein